MLPQTGSRRHPAPAGEAASSSASPAGGPRDVDVAEMT